MINLIALLGVKMSKVPEYTLKTQKRYRTKTKEFRKRVLPEEFEKLLAYWKELISNRDNK